MNSPPDSSGLIEASIYLYGTQLSGLPAPRTVSRARQPRAVPPTPVLVKREIYPSASTLYVGIKLGPENPARPMTGIFVCSNFRPQPQVDFILYLHGHKAGHMPLSVSIDKYWKMRQFGLREELNASRKNVILVAPTLGPKSEPGALTARNGLDTYLNQVLSALREYGPYRSAATPPTVGNIILASHSGGGFAMLLLATSQQQYTPHIRECWGFDCMYGSVRDEGVERVWARWARSHPDAKLYISYLGSTAERSQRLMRERLPNVFVARSTAQDHNHVPITHWRERIRGTPFLHDT